MTVSMPEMLRHIIVEEVLGPQFDMDIVDELSTLNRREELETKGPSDIVIVCLEHGELPEPCRAFIDVAPANKVLGITPDGSRSILCLLAPQTIELGEVSMDELADTIRWATQGAPA